MCFKVVFDKTILGITPAFTGLLNESFPEGVISAFQFPRLPILAADSQDRAIGAQWGLIPSWVHNEDQAKKIRSGTVNARSESVHEKPSFRGSWPEKRCILPVSGFFEPHVTEGSKESWYIARKDNRPFFLGGLYAPTPKGLAGYHFPTFSLLTLAARDLLAEVHNGKLRMPLLMDETKAMAWLESRVKHSDLFDASWQFDQTKLVAEPEEREKKSDFLKETSLF